MKLKIHTPAAIALTVLFFAVPLLAQQRQVKMAGFTTSTAPAISSSAVVHKGVFSTPVMLKDISRVYRVVLGTFLSPISAFTPAYNQPDHVILGLFPGLSAPSKKTS